MPGYYNVRDAGGRFARATAYYIPNRPYIYGVIPELPIVQIQVSHKADKIAERAKSIAPVRTGFYRDSIVAVEAEGGKPGEWVVVANDPKAAYLEYGTSDTPTFATLRTAAEGEGLDFQDAD